MAELSELGRRLYGVLGDQSRHRISTATGQAAKTAALDAAAHDLGGDRAMRNFRDGTVSLRAGYTIRPGTVAVELRPGGVWVLADRGRRRAGRIYPRRDGRKATGPVPGRALLTPVGFRASSSYGPSRGKGTIGRAAAKIGDTVPSATLRQLTDELSKALR